MLPYLRLELLRILRDRRYLLFTVAFPLGVYLFYTQVDNGATRIGGTTWAAYMLVSMAAYGAMGAALATGSARMAAERSSGWIRQLRATPLPGPRLPDREVAAGMLVALPTLLLVALAGALVNGVQLPALRWLELLWLGTLPFAGLGILIGCLLDATSSQPAMVGTYMLLAILGGLWAPLESLPSALRAIARVLPSYHFADLGWRTVDGSAPAPADLLSLAAYAIGFGALGIWTYRRRVAAR
jgi:ABC-2 type transport system permease protein